MKTPPTRLILILAGLLILAVPARLAAQDTLDPKDVMAAPQRFWLQYYLFRDTLVDLPGGTAAIDFGDGPHYAFTTKGFRSMYATREARDVLANLERNREYLFRGTVQNKRGKYYYTVTEVMDVKEDPKAVIPPEMIGDNLRAIQSNQALAQMLFKIQAGMLIYSQREGVSYKDLFNPESPHYPKLTQIVRDVVGAQERTPQNPSEILAISIKNALEGYYGDPNARKMEENIPAEVLLQVQAYVTEEQKAAIAAAAAKSAAPAPTPAPAPVPSTEAPPTVPAPEAPAPAPKVEDPNAFAPRQDSAQPPSILGNEPDDVLERMLNKSNTTSVGNPPDAAPNVTPVAEEDPKTPAPAPVTPVPEIPVESLIPAPSVPAVVPEVISSPEPAPAPAPTLEPSIPVIGAAVPATPEPEPTPAEPEKMTPAPADPAPVPAEVVPAVVPPADPASAEPVPAETPVPAPAEPVPAEPLVPAPVAPVPEPTPAPVAAPQEKIDAVISTEELDRLMQELNIPVPAPAETAPAVAPAEPAPIPVEPPPADPAPTVDPVPAPVAPLDPAPVVPAEAPAPAEVPAPVETPLPIEPAPVVTETPAPVVPDVPASAATLEVPAPMPADPVPVIPETPAPPTDLAPVIPVVPEPAPEVIPAPPSDALPVTPAPVIQEPAPAPVAPKPPPMPKTGAEKKKESPAKKNPTVAEKPAEKPEAKPAAAPAKPAEEKPKEKGFYDPDVDFHFKNLPK